MQLMFKKTKIAIIGTVGVPANYGGFETLVENLINFSSQFERVPDLTVYCSGHAYQERVHNYRHARLIYLPIKANGTQSIIYDIWSMLSAVRSGHNQLLILGVSGCILLPILRRFSRVRILTNIDGLEWRRDKWGATARWFLRLSERLAVLHSHVVIADNQAIVDHVLTTYGRQCELISYGGDHALVAPACDISKLGLPRRYSLSLCRIEPENNVQMILEAFRQTPDESLVFVGNWSASGYGRKLRSEYLDNPNLFLLDAIYDPGKLRSLREAASLYVHGHSAGGTNPSLVEMMHFDTPVAAFDCSYNRYTTENKAFYFDSVEQLCAFLADRKASHRSAEEGMNMAEIANNRYTWERVGAAYFNLLRQD